MRIRRGRFRWAVVGLIALTALAVAVGGLATDASARSVDSAERSGALNPRALRGGVLATFDVHGELFRVWVTNPETIEQLFALQAGTSTASIPIGPIRRGPGRAAHNRPWHWHLDPAEVTLADFTIEVCDATPSYVEENLQYFVETVGSYCPWGAVLVDLQDFR